MNKDSVHKIENEWHNFNDQLSMIVCSLPFNNITGFLFNFRFEHNNVEINSAANSVINDVFYKVNKNKCTIDQIVCCRKSSHALKNIDVC